MARAPLLGLLDELHPQLRDGVFNQAGLVPHDHIHIFRWNNLPRRINHVPYAAVLPPTSCRTFGTLAFEPRAFSRSHDHDGKLHPVPFGSLDGSTGSPWQE